MRSAFILIILLVVTAIAHAQQKTGTQLEQSVPRDGFIKNAGQVKDFYGRPVRSVLYQANLGGQQVYITEQGLSIVLSRKLRVVKKSAATTRTHKQVSADDQHKKPNDSLTTISYEMERTDITLVGAHIRTSNISSIAKAQSPLYNFYFDNYSYKAEGLNLLSSVLIKEVYPGIDWKIYIVEDSTSSAVVKYDFIIHPGAEIARIRLHYSDNVELSLAQGNIIAKGKMGAFKDSKPFTYTKADRQEVSSAFKVDHNNLSFVVGNYNKSQDLVIDPTVFWLTYISSSAAIQQHGLEGDDIETDDNGNIFVQASINGNTPFPTVNPGNGAYYQDVTTAPNSAMLLIKFSKNGQLLWSTYFGSQSPVIGFGMTRDKNNNIYVIGRFPATILDQIPLLNNGGYFDPIAKSTFISSFSNGGVLRWSSYFGSFDTYPMDLTYDISGNIYVTGWSTNYLFPTVDPGGGAYVVTQPQYGYAQTLFVSQFNASNQLIWSTRIEGNDYDPSARICTDKAGNIYLGGQARSANIPMVNAGGYFDDGGWGSVIIRFNAARKITWSSYVPDPFSLEDITVDDQGNMYAVSAGRVMKFDANTNMVFNKIIAPSKSYFLRRIIYDPVHNNLQILGQMNDSYYNMPAINTACNGSFFYDVQTLPRYQSATGPIFSTMTLDGDFTYFAPMDWAHEYYENCEMSVDPEGNPVYIFGEQQNGYSAPNPDLTNPGNGAYFEPNCCYNSSTHSALLLKLVASELSVTSQVTAPVNCACTGEITLTPTCGQAPFTYTWSNGATTSSVSGLCPGNYEVTVTDAKNLSRKLWINMPYPPGSISAIAKTVNPENCKKSNGSIAIYNITGGASPYTYSLDGFAYSSSNQFNNLDSGEYIVRVKDANGCIFNDTIVVGRLAGPTDISFSLAETGCTNNSGQINITGVTNGVSPFNYILSNNTSNTSGLFDGLTAGDYLVTVRDATGCEFTKTVSILQASPPISTTITISPDHCGQHQGSIEATSVTGGKPPYTYSIDGNQYSAGIITGLAANSYTLFVKDANGCIFQKTGIIVADEPGPSQISLSVKDAVCGALKGQIAISSVQGGVAPYQYKVDNGLFTSSTSFNEVSPGNHICYIRDANGCTLERTVSISYVPMESFVLTPKDTLVCFNTSVPFSLTGNQQQIVSYNWNIPANRASAELVANKDQEVIVKITDRNGCSSSDTATVSVKACSPPEKCLLVPTAFTPNNDGINDRVGPVTNGCRIENLDFKIYNRWGEVVFQSSNLSNKWDGRFKGGLLASDSYVFHCTYTTDDGQQRSQSGNIMLIR